MDRSANAPSILPDLLLDSASQTQDTDESGWEDVIQLAVSRGVGAYLGWRYAQSKLPAVVSKRLWGIHEANRTRNLQIAAREERILAAFREAGLAVWPLKGPRLSEFLYGDPGVRQTSDIDLLIRPEDVTQAHRVLTGLGYRAGVAGDDGSLNRLQEIYFASPADDALQVPVDLQLRIVPAERDPLADRIRSEGLTRENLLLYLCVNQVLHRFSSLKQFCDVRAMLDAHGAQLDWDRFTQAARELPVAPGVYYSLELARSFFHAPLPSAVADALRPGRLSRRLMRRLVGADLPAVVANSERLDAPYGAMVALLCLRPGMARVRGLWQILFPSAAYVREQAPASADRRAPALHLARWRQSVPAALRHLLRSLLG